MTAPQDGAGCGEMRLLIQADVDGELSPAEAAKVSVHLDGCSGCAEFQTALLALSARLRDRATHHAAPPALRAAILAQVPRAVAAAPALVEREGGWRSRRPVAAFGGGFALAACLAVLLVLPRTGSMPDAVFSSHLRALQPGHLLDVVSTDQHTVKPWFDGRIDYAPAVKDLAAQGFPLEGGRLDVLQGRPVAALVYRSRQHAIDLYIVPGVSAAPAEGTIQGYNFLHWSQNGTSYWAISDVAGGDLARFVALWRGG